MGTKKEFKWDVFISHASEDKEKIARPLAQKLHDKGLDVWFDEFSLEVGDRLFVSIDFGLSNSKFGIVILSKHFFSKRWPKEELGGLFAKETLADKVILPILHNLSIGELIEYSPILADRILLDSNLGLDKLVEKLINVIAQSSKKRGQELSRFEQVNQKLQEYEKRKEIHSELPNEYRLCSYCGSPAIYKSGDIHGVDRDELIVKYECGMEYSRNYETRWCKAARQTNDEMMEILFPKKKWKRVRKKRLTKHVRFLKGEVNQFLPPYYMLITNK